MTSQMKRDVRAFWFAWVFFISICFPPVARGGDSAKAAGDWLQIVIPTAAYGFTFVRDDPEGRMQFYKGFFTAIGLTQGLKRIVNSTRPNGSRFAFPAGHVSAAFSGAAFLTERYGWPHGLPAYLGAAYVGWSRVDSDEHFWEDVLAGAVIGMAATAYFTEPEDDLRVHIAVGRDAYVLMIEKRW